MGERRRCNIERRAHDQERHWMLRLGSSDCGKGDQRVCCGRGLYNDFYNWYSLKRNIMIWIVFSLGDECFVAQASVSCSIPLEAIYAFEKIVVVSKLICRCFFILPLLPKEVRSVCRVHFSIRLWQRRSDD